MSEWQRTLVALLVILGLAGFGILLAVAVDEIETRAGSQVTARDPASCITEKAKSISVQGHEQQDSTSSKAGPHYPQ